MVYNSIKCGIFENDIRLIYMESIVLNTILAWIDTIYYPKVKYDYEHNSLLIVWEKQSYWKILKWVLLSLLEKGIG